MFLIHLACALTYHRPLDMTTLKNQKAVVQFFVDKFRKP